jgi:hypothetical protein
MHFDLKVELKKKIRFLDVITLKIYFFYLIIILLPVLGSM